MLVLTEYNTKNTTMYKDLVYQIALTQIPRIGDVHAKVLLQHFGSAEAVFAARRRDLEALPGIGTVRANSVKYFTDFSSSEAEIDFIEKYRITPLCLNNPAYPQRLLHCYDSPPLLYYRGNADLNSQKILAIVGTRNFDDYGRQVTESILEELKEQPILIVSGLALGIDSLAHKAAIRNGLPTVGILAHGLDRLYPSVNKKLAKEMLEQGGLLTDYRSGTNPDRQNFPQRNRIVAGICDALLVIESGKKGGSLITAEMANGYNKDVFAIPGKATDARSEGCNYLVKQNKAALVTNAKDIMAAMNWLPVKKPTTKQRKLFVDLSDNEKMVLELLQQNSHHIDELYCKTGIASSGMAAALLSLEMQGIISSQPGKMYQLL